MDTAGNRASMTAPSPSKRWYRWLRLAIGWCFVVFGIVGLVLPFLQGILFLLIGLLILASEQAWASALLDRLLKRFPRLAVKLREAEGRSKALLRRIAGWFGSSDR